MKDFKNCIALTMLSAAILSGCQVASQEIKSDALQNQVQKYNLADQAAYQGAVELKDVSYCKRIQDKQYKKTCAMDVQDRIALAAAVSKSDSSLCAKLGLKVNQEACRITIEVQQQQAQLKTRKNAEIKAMYDQLNSIVESRDANHCKDLQDANLAQTCEQTIAANKTAAK